MVRQMAWRRGLCFVFFLLILSLIACGRGVSQQVVRPVPGSQNVPVSDISATAAQSLMYMGYLIQEQNPEMGYIYARKPVAEDLYGRSVEMKVNVIPVAAGEKQLSVEAITCPGCVPQATFDPAWMADRFYTTFDLFAGRAGLYSRSPTIAQGSYAPNQPVDPQGRIADERTMKFVSADVKRKVQMGIVIENITPETAASLGLRETKGVMVRQIDPGGPAGRTNLAAGDVIMEVDGKPVADSVDVVLTISERSPGDTVTLTVSRQGRIYRQPLTLAKRQEQETGGAPAQLPAVQITRVAVSPTVVPAGSTFEVIVEYAAKDPATQLKQITTQLTIDILESEKVLYTHGPIEVSGENGGVTKRTEPLASSKKAGAFAVRATVKYGETSATRQTGFTIQ